MKPSFRRHPLQLLRPKRHRRLKLRGRNTACSASIQRGWTGRVAPGGNFYQFANGTWAKKHAYPCPSNSNYGSFNILDDLSRERTRGIIEEQAKDPNSRIGNAYASFMDTAAVEAKGLAAFAPWLDEIRSAKAKKDIRQALLGR